MSTTDFKNMDTTVYWDEAKKYLPQNIKFLFVAESPPAFMNKEKPESYFYFEEINGDILFYTLIKALYDEDFTKGADSKIKYLQKFKEDGYFLIDSVEYPINKTITGNKIKDNVRKEIILLTKTHFLNRINKFKSENIITNRTKAILIKKTVFSVYKKCSSLNILNSRKINFPRYFKDKEVVINIRNAISL